MSALKVPYLKELSPENSQFVTEELIASGAVIDIDKINWNEFPHLVNVKAYAGFNDQYLCLYYQVKNDLLRVDCHEDQDPVWQDSCVEFFLKQGDIYRNFEFNSIGVCLSAYGPDRNSRKSLEKDSLIRILRFPSLNKNSLPLNGMSSDWSLTVAIPLDLLGLVAGSQFKANFYKCGDETLVPHYISWSPIGTSSPDFHQPDYFGLVELEK